MICKFSNTKIPASCHLDIYVSKTPLSSITISQSVQRKYALGEITPITCPLPEKFSFYFSRGGVLKFNAKSLFHFDNFTITFSEQWRCE
jgi:hypothetical protein